MSIDALVAFEDVRGYFSAQKLAQWVSRHIGAVAFCKYETIKFEEQYLPTGRWVKLLHCYNCSKKTGLMTWKFLVMLDYQHLQSINLTFRRSDMKIE